MARPLNRDRRRKRLALALGINLVLVAGELVAGWLGHTSALLAEAGHDLIDVVGLAAALGAIQWAAKPRSDERSFGNHRATILAALFNATALALVTVSIVALSVDRLVHPVTPDARVLSAVAGGALVINGLAALALRERSADLGVRAAFVHMTSDAAAAAVAFAAGIVILVAGPHAALADPAAALAVSVLIILQAGRLLRSSIKVLLESTPADLDLSALRLAISADDGVAELHDLHVWSLSSEVRALSAHLVLVGHPTLEEAQVVAGRVREAVVTRFGLAHTTFELECERCSDTADPCEVAGVPDAELARPGR